MEFHRGRLFDHVHLQVSDLEASKRFYEAVLGALGRKITAQGPDFFAADELLVTQSDGAHSHVHLALQAEDQAAVRRFHSAAIAAGARDNGAPGERPYHPGYYAAFVLDPDGNNVEAVFHGPAQRSAESVVISAPG